MFEFLLHAPNRAVFAAVVKALINPLTGEPFGRDFETEDGSTVLVYPTYINVDEIGPIEDVPGHHVNVLIDGELAEFMTAGRPTEGDIFERTSILEILGDLVWKAADDIPEGWEGSSKIRIYDPAMVKTRARVFAL